MKARDSGAAPVCEWTETAAAFVLGALQPDEQRAFEAHLEGCAPCREERALASEEVALADLVEAEDSPLAPAASLRGRVLEALAREGRGSKSGDLGDLQVWRQWDATPAPAVAGLRTLSASDDGWEPIPIEGIHVKRLAVDPRQGSITMLVRMAPGTSYPRHRHAGMEQCFVIEGDIRVEGGPRLKAGDFQVADSDSVHAVQSTEGGCTLLIVSSQADELL